LPALRPPAQADSAAAARNPADLLTLSAPAGSAILTIDATGQPAAGRAARRRVEGGREVLKEFKEFALKGNVVDLAIGFIIGAAFSGLVQSVVNDLIMPIIGRITGGLDFTQMYWQLSGAPAATLDQAREAGATLAYGNFITLLINFLIVAWVLFLVVKAMNRMKRQPPPDVAPPPPSREEVLLGEIRDLLAKR
jgi:large conductance mechanosensitive channel